MANPIEVKLLANTSGLTRGTKDVVGEFDKVGDSLDDLGKGGKNASDKLEQSLRDQQTAAKNTSSEYGNLKKSIIDNEAAGTKSIELNQGQRTKLVKTAAKQAGAAAKTSLGGDLTAMTQSADGAISGVGNTVGGILATFGPLGAAAATAVGIATGLISAAFQKGEQNTKKFKAGVADLTKELIDAGDKGAPSLQYIIDKLKTLATTTEDGDTKLSDLKKTADGSGSSFKDLAAVYDGSTTNLKALIAAGKDRLSQLYDEADAYSKQGVQYQGDTRYADTIKQINAQKDYNKYLQTAGDTAAAAAKQEKLYAEAGGPAMERKAAYISAINDAYDDGAKDLDDYIDKESGLFDTSRYIRAMQAKQTALNEYQEDLAKSPLSDTAKDFLNSQGADAAAQFLAGYKKATPAQKSALNDIWTEAGKSNSGEYTSALNSGIQGATIKAPKIPAPDFSEADRRIKEWAKKPITLTLEGKTRTGQKVI